MSYDGMTTRIIRSMTASVDGSICIIHGAIMEERRVIEISGREARRFVWIIVYYNRDLRCTSRLMQQDLVLSSTMLSCNAVDSIRWRIGVSALQQYGSRIGLCVLGVGCPIERLYT